MSKNNVEINVYAGRAGSGKTHFIRESVKDLLHDPNNVVIYIGNRGSEIEFLKGETENLPGLFYAASENCMGKLIGTAMDLMYREETAASIVNDDNFQSVRKQVYLFCDDYRHQTVQGSRDLITAAGKAGISVNISCQNFSQVGSVMWLTQHADCFIVKKDREPRLATIEEIKKIYY